MMNNLYQQLKFDVWFRDASNGQETTGRAGGGRAKDAEILFGETPKKDKSRKDTKN